MLRDIIRKLKEDGKTVLLTTHNLAEVEELCDRLVIINNGKVIAKGTPQSIKGSYASLEDSYVELVKGVSA
jgi:ABC-2 type transport system ATP-binding protein